MLPDILATKNPNEFRGNRIRMRHESGRYLAEVVEPSIPFREMMGYRKQPCNSQKVKEGLAGEGYVFANMGLSSILTTTINGVNYAMVVIAQAREDVGDVANKLLSGYIDSLNIHEPLKALEEEVSEEFLPCSADEKILSGMRKLHPLPRRFEGKMAYDDALGFQMIESYFFELPDLARGEVLIDGRAVEGNPGLYFQIPTNSVQLVFNYHLDIPSIPNGEFDINHAELSYVMLNGSDMHHTEDKFVPERGILEVRTHRQGILLIELKKNRLTNKVYTFKRGELIPRSSDITLSEAFAPKDDGIVTAPNIKLSDFVQEYGDGSL